MKQERKFMFVGNPFNYSGNYEYGVIYKGNIRLPGSTSNVDILAKYNPEDWEEVTEQEEKPRFKFIGDEDVYPVIKKGEIVPFGFEPKEWAAPVQDYAEKYPNDWEIVEDEPTWIFEPANQDQPASSMTKFEKCVIDIIGNIYSNINIKTQTPTYQEISQIAINQAKETFKQLEKWQE